MNARSNWFLFLVCIVAGWLSFSVSIVNAQGDPEKEKPEGGKTGQVSLALSQYNQLVDAARQPVKEPRVPPSGYAFGQAQAQVNVNEIDERASAQVKVDFNVKVLDNDWISVPILPSGTAVREVTVNSSSVQLINSSQGLLWGVKGEGNYAIRIVYDVDAQRFDTGYALALPLPAAAAISLNARIPGTGIDATVIPSSGLKTTTSDQATNITATIPSTSGAQISWRVPRKESHTISRALYVGELTKDAVVWKGSFDVELFNDETLTLKVLPNDVTLREIQVDGIRSNIVVQDNHFATLIKGRGAHKLEVSFQVSLNKQDGPPRINFTIPEIPVSQFELSLPGKKELQVTPASNVISEFKADTTYARVFVPMTSGVSFSWSEALPEEVKAELRSNVSIFHTAHAEEGVLYMHAIAQYNITRGKLRSIELVVPQDVQINRVESAQDIIADWRVAKDKDNASSLLTVFLDREMESDFEIHLYYDRSIVSKQAKERIDIPLLSAQEVNRQRGMVALLATKELTLKPIEEERITRVGENQLPPSVRQNLSMTIAHTYKYVEASPRLVAQATEPEKKQGKFDAVVNTLFSLKDVSIAGAAVCEVNVKSGRISSLILELPKGVNFLNLTGPSIRNHNVTAKEDRQEIEVNFTQDMEGQFRLEATYERILADAEPKLDLPRLDVQGAEAKTGFIAVEALSAVEIQPVTVEQLSSVQTNELPQQLVLKTTNPILLAYKFVTIPYTLQLSITRHKVIDVQTATIDKAVYRTLIVKDGFAITTVEFIVRNSQKQFLRVLLPKEANIWSVVVDGRPEKPAIAESAKNLRDVPAKDVLIKVINETKGFPVTLVYQTPIGKLGHMGFIDEVLPKPDMVVTHTRWEVYLPDDMQYGRLSTNMQEIDAGTFQSEAEIKRQMNAAQISNKKNIQSWQNMPQGQSDMSNQEAGNSIEDISSLYVHVPKAGIRYVFEKLYANQADDDSFFALLYFSQRSNVVSQTFVIFVTLLFWVGVAGIAGKQKLLPKNLESSIAVASATMLAIAIGYMELNYKMALLLSVVAVFIIFATTIMKLVAGRRFSSRSTSHEDKVVE